MTGHCRKAVEAEKKGVQGLFFISSPDGLETQSANIAGVISELYIKAAPLLCCSRFPPNKTDAARTHVAEIIILSKRTPDPPPFPKACFGFEDALSVVPWASHLSTTNGGEIYSIFFFSLSLF